MTSDQIRTEIDKLRTLANRDQFNPALWYPLWEIAYQLAVQNESRDVSKEVLEKIHQISGEVDAMQVDIRKLTKALLLTLKAVKAELGTQDASSPKTEPGTPEVTKK